MSSRPSPRTAGRLSPVLLVLLTVAGPAPAADKAVPAADVFADGKVWQVHISLSAEEYAAMQPRPARGGFGFGGLFQQPQKPADPMREMHRNQFGMDLPWATGAVTLGDRAFPKVGVRYKGNGTIGDAGRTVKKSFKIDLDRAGGDGRFGGSKTVNLHCGVTDPTKLRESLGYELYRAAGVPAPRTAFAEVRLTVPGKHDNQLLGMYTLVEEVDKPFARDRFGSDAGLLLKPEGVREFEDKGDRWDGYKNYHPKREPTSAESARLIAFARLVQKADDPTFRVEVGHFLDVDGYLRFLAATSFIVNSDSFFALGHNYYLYLHPKTNRLHVMPWDLDRAFANFPILGSSRQQMNLNLAHPYGGTHRLTERLLAVPAINEKYKALWAELAAKAFDKSRLLARLTALEAATGELHARDTAATAARKEPAGGFGPAFGQPPPLRTFLEKRTASVAAQLAGTSKGHTPAGGPGGPPLGPIMAGIMMDNLDTDRDERLSREEWLTITRKLTAACAKGTDGTITAKSLTTGLNSLLPNPAEAGRPGGFSLGHLLADPILARADADKDGKLTADELLTAAAAAFDEADKGKTGTLDEEAFGGLLGRLLPALAPGRPPPARKER